MPDYNFWAVIKTDAGQVVVKKTTVQQVATQYEAHKRMIENIDTEHPNAVKVYVIEQTKDNIVQIAAHLMSQMD
jgi:hypothetical protein